jgi:probable rRNA maturation factor
MAHDTNASDTAPEPDSPDDDDISYSDWQSPAGAVIEARVDTKIWPDALVNSFQQTAPKVFDAVLAVHCSAPAIISLCLCDDLQIQRLNLKHRKIDKATNVLSFPACDMRSDRIDPLVPALLGDIVIAAEAVVREADAMQIRLVDHLMHLFVHGMLHLLGYDHIEDDMADAMETLEIKFLAQFGIANPYKNAQLEGDL